jgi:small-conductance mechanosensitive channel
LKIKDIIGTPESQKINLAQMELMQHVYMEPRLLSNPDPNILFDDFAEPAQPQIS